MERIEKFNNITLYLGDSREILSKLIKNDNQISALITDPPYGIREAWGKAKTRTAGFAKRNSKYLKDYGKNKWDNNPIEYSFIEKLLKWTKYQIIFGGNYYPLPPTSCWLIWDKLTDGNDFADCEMAWTNFDRAIRIKRFLWRGCIRKERHILRIHPTQKPIEIMEWCLTQLPEDTNLIFDPFLGSGTTAIAALKLSSILNPEWSFIGIEANLEYFEMACKRIKLELRKPNLLR
jgi:DNA modification methylase